MRRMRAVSMARDARRRRCGRSSDVASANSSSADSARIGHSLTTDRHLGCLDTHVSFLSYGGDPPDHDPKDQPMTTESVASVGARMPDIALTAPDGTTSTLHGERAGRPAVVF